MKYFYSCLLAIAVLGFLFICYTETMVKLYQVRINERRLKLDEARFSFEILLHTVPIEAPTPPPDQKKL